MTERVCGLPTEVYSRVCGYLRPVAQWNPGKKAEYSEREPFRDAQITVDGESLADLAAMALNHLQGRDSVQVHTEADWLRTNGHELAGELLEIIASARDSVSR